jgi:hypothetical protein
MAGGSGAAALADVEVDIDRRRINTRHAPPRPKRTKALVGPRIAAVI